MSIEKISYLTMILEKKYNTKVNYPTSYSDILNEYKKSFEEYLIVENKKWSSGEKAKKFLLMELYYNYLVEIYPKRKKFKFKKSKDENNETE